jgi:hypothetical protein
LAEIVALTRSLATRWDAVLDPADPQRDRTPLVGRRVDEETVRIHLTIAPVYLRKMHLLSGHFATVPAEIHAE